MIRVALSVLLSLIAVLPAAAQDWPAKPVSFVVPFPPGGSVDPLARLVSAKLNDALKQQFIVENKPGASGSIGTAFVAKAKPDGYTFVFVFDTHAVNPALIPGMQFDTAIAIGAVPTSITGARSFAVSNWIAGLSDGLTAWVSNTKTKV